MATKIEKFNEIKARFERMKNNCERALGLDSSSNDKALAKVRVGAPYDRTDEIALTLTMRYGYYGNSSSYSAVDEFTAKYIVEVINRNMRGIIDEALKLAEQDVKVAAREAKEEAEAILAEVASE